MSLALASPISRYELRLARMFPAFFRSSGKQVSLQLRFPNRRQPFSMRQSSSDLGVARQVFAMRDYRLDDFVQTGALERYLQQLLADGSTPLIIDAGANIGASAVWFSNCFPQSTIIAIEPEKANCDLLRENTKGLPVEILEAAVSSENKVGSLADPGRGEWAFRLSDSGGVPVTVLAASGLIAEQVMQGRCPFIFKIDIEGGEGELFERDVDWMDEFALLIVELHDWQLAGAARSRSFLRAIADRDFDFVYRGENVFCFNNIFLRKYYGS